MKYNKTHTKKMLNLENNRRKAIRTCLQGYHIVIIDGVSIIFCY